MFIYFYHAIAHISPNSTAHAEGLYSSASAVANEEGFIAFKAAISEQFATNVPEVDKSTIVIDALTFLHEVDNGPKI